MSDDTKTEEQVATIDHEEVHVNISKKGVDGNAPEVITSQPTVGYDKDGGKVNIGNQSVPVVAQGPLDPKRKPKDFVVTSCLVTMFCNFIFGLLGYHYGVKANHAWQLGDEVASRNRARTALIFVICGVIAGIITYTLVFTLYFTLNKNPDFKVSNPAPAG